MTAEAEAESESVKLKGLAEAEANRVVALAEAEKMRKVAEALKNYQVLYIYYSNRSGFIYGRSFIRLSYRQGMIEYNSIKTVRKIEEQTRNVKGSSSCH